MLVFYAIGDPVERLAISIAKSADGVEVTLLFKLLVKPRRGDEKVCIGPRFVQLLRRSLALRSNISKRLAYRGDAFAERRKSLSGKPRRPGEDLLRAGGDIRICYAPAAAWRGAAEIREVRKACD